MLCEQYYIRIPPEHSLTEFLLFILKCRCAMLEDPPPESDEERRKREERELVISETKTGGTDEYVKRKADALKARGEGALICCGVLWTPRCHLPCHATVL